MQDGTYLYMAGQFIPLAVTEGYWVAYQETTLDELTDGEIVGVWTDSETGKTWFDKSRLFATLDGAITAGRAYDQLAIWDNSKQEEVRIA